MMRFLLFCLCAAALWAQPLERKIAQMLLVGFKGTHLTPKNPIYDDIVKRGIGGVILFDYDLQTKRYGRNITSPQQLRTLTKQLQKLSDIPLFIAVDYEGGRVSRLKPKLGFPPTLSQAKLGAMDNLAKTKAQSDLMARTLQDVGINLNFAPVVDLNINPKNPVIGALGRSYGKNPKKVVRHARTALRSYEAHGIIPVLKHFPGHGSSTRDSHLGVVDVSDTYRKAELYPYRALIDSNDTRAIMGAHVYNARFDAQLPATLSKPTITGLLRTSLGFEGVVFSDDIQMEAIGEEYGLKETLYNMIDAGIDVIVIGNNLGEYDPQIAANAIGHITALIREGRIDKERIDRSWRRIRALKTALRP